MSHVYVAIYMIALLSGALLLPALYLGYRRAKAFKETFAIYVVLSVLVLLGACTLYVAVNVSPYHFLFKMFVAAAFVHIAALIFLLPRQHHQLCNVPSEKQHPFFWQALALINLTISGLLWLVSDVVMKALMATSLICLLGTIIYCQIVYRRFQTSVCKKPKSITLVLPLVSIGLGLLEGFVFGEGIVQRGVILSLPLIYIFHCMSVWWLRHELFPPIAAPAVALEFTQLTAKEREIVDAVLKGLSNKQIAADFGLSTSTVKNHLYTVFKKLGVTNRYALMNGVAGKQLLQ
jgi:DNA-binding CsgD family transcriptional regulator